MQLDLNIVLKTFRPLSRGLHQSSSLHCHEVQDQLLPSEVLLSCGCFCSNPHAMEHDWPEGETTEVNMFWHKVLLNL